MSDRKRPIDVLQMRKRLWDVRVLSRNEWADNKSETEIWFHVDLDSKENVLDTCLQLKLNHDFNRKNGQLGRFNFSMAVYEIACSLSRYTYKKKKKKLYMNEHEWKSGHTTFVILSCDPHCQLRCFIFIHKNSLFVFFGALLLKSLSLLLYGECSGYISCCVSHKDSSTRSVWCECANDKIQIFRSSVSVIRHIFYI